MRPAPSQHTVPPGGSAYCVVYDADCGICSRSVLWLQRQSIREPVRWLPLDSEDARRLVPNRPADEMAVVGPEGELWLGGDGWAICLWLTRYRWFGKLMGLPGVRWIVRVVYPLVARNRARVSRMLGLTSCDI